MSNKNEIVPLKGSIEELEKFARIEAVEGKTESIKLLADIQYSKYFDIIRSEILYDSDIDENIFNRLEDYIESGSTIQLKEGEGLYLEAMTKMMFMRRKFGRANTIKFFCAKPFNLKYAEARNMYERALNLFYIDTKIEKRAMRNLKAQQFEDAAEVVLRTAKTPKDFETYSKLIIASAKMLQLHLPDFPDVPKDTFTRPYQVYTLDPKLIGMDRIDRNLLGKQIDNIPGATEIEKELAKGDAGIKIVPFEEIINEHKEKD